MWRSEDYALKAITPEEAEDVAGRLYGMVPNARISGVLDDIDRWTGFSRAFTHLHTGLPADDPRVVLTAVLADAANLGLTRMADASNVARYRKLSWTAGWHLREDTCRQALAMTVNAQQRHSLAAAFGAPDVSSSDGQHCLTAGRCKAVGAINARYGHDVTALFYTHHSARHAPYHVTAIPPSGEAAHVIDGVLYHEADLSIATHHTDGGRSATMCSRSRTCSASCSPHASRTWPSAGCMLSTRRGHGRRLHRSSPVAPTRS